MNKNNISVKQQSAIKSDEHFPIRGWKLKIFGGLILLLSFLSQQLFLDYWDDKIKKWEYNLQGYFLTDLSSLTYQNLYFSSGLLTKIMNEKLIMKAAEENAIGLTAMILSESGSKDDKIKSINDIFDRSRKVNDFDSFNAYIEWTNSMNFRPIEKINNHITKLHSQKAFWRWIFIAFYLFGSLIVLIGTYIGKKESLEAP